MNRLVFTALLNNGAMLLAMVTVYVLFVQREEAGGNLFVRQVLAGMVLGFLCIGLILSAYEFESGIIFDTRSVLLSLSGLFFGTVPVLIAMAMSSALRLAQGGAAAWTGTAVIFASGVTGLVWRHFIIKKPFIRITWQKLYFLGLAVHLIMLALMFILPGPVALRVLSGIGMPVLLIYPVITLLAGLLLQRNMIHRRNAAALAEDEEACRSLFENNHTVMLLVDPADGTIVNANPAACQFYGWRRDELCRMRIQQINTLSSEKVREALRSAREGKNKIFHFKHRLADRSVRDVEVITGTVTMDNRSLLYSIIQDISGRKTEEAAREKDFDEARRANRDLLAAMDELKKTETALRESRENLRITLRSIGDAVICTDATGRVTLMNPVAEQLTGWTQEKASGHPLTGVFKIINEYSRETVKNPVTEVLKRGQIVGLANHTLLISKDGREIPIADSGAPIINLDDEITGVVLVFSDQTMERATRRALEKNAERYRILFEKQKETEGELKQRLEELERFNKASVGRELRMVELKKEINALCRELGRKEPYRVDFD